MPDITVPERDARHLHRAIELAGLARGQVSPNPMVGAVIVKSGRVIGEGVTQPPGEGHAERMALGACDVSPAGATLYVSLEPCCHHGRTPPCTDAIIEAGIARVVIASDDPTPKAAGRGPGILRDEGVEVRFMDGEVADAARLLNQPFRKHARTGRPLAVGIGTALMDDPQLTARIEGVARQPRRVVFDSEARLPLESQLVRGVADVPVTVVCGRAASRTSVQALESAGVDVIVATGGNEAARAASALDGLGQRDIQSVLLEGGPHLAGAFLEAAEIDEARIFIAPFMIGGAKAKTAVEGIGVAEIAGAARPIAVESERIDDDVLITARFKEW